MRHLRPRFNLAPLAIALALTVPGFVQAQTADGSKAVAISIENQSLGSALNALSTATGIPIAFSPALVAGKTAPTVKGRLTMRQALSQLLADSGLAASENGGNIVIKNTSSNDVTTLSDIIVTGEQENAYGPVEGYIAKRSATGTKTDTPLIEVPQSISVVSAEQIEVMKPQNLAEALNYTAGVGLGSRGPSRVEDTVMLRGFSVDTGSQYRDGSRFMGHTYSGQQEPYGLERVEILKGASSILYGAIGPGGIINTVTKRPSITPIRELNVTSGSFNKKQISGDFSDRFSSESDWSYRLTFLHRKSDAFIDYIKDDRTFIAPALKWQPNAATSFTLLSEFQRDDTNYAYDLPKEGTIYPNINGQIPRNRYTGEKSRDTDSSIYNRKSLGYIFEHDFNESTKLRHNFRYTQNDNKLTFVAVYGISPDQRGPAGRLIQIRDFTSKVLTADTSIQHKWQAGSVKNTSLIGMDYSQFNYREKRSNRDYFGNFDYFSPIYDQPYGKKSKPRISQEINNNFGLYLQNQAKILDKWVALVTLRQDWSETINDGVAESAKALTGRMGFVYLAENGLAPFFSYSQSFEPTAGTDRNGSRFKPTRGEQYELGIRYQPSGKDVLLSAAIYDLTQKNVTVKDPIAPLYNIQQGEVRSRGFELEARARLWKDTNLIAAYAYTDARTLKSSPLTPELKGRRKPQVPYNQLSVWVDHNFGSLGLPGLKAGLGGRYVSATKGYEETTKVSSYLVFDAMVSYTVDSWRFALNATNLTDKTYVAGCYWECGYGEGRNIIGTVTYSW